MAMRRYVFPVLLAVMSISFAIPSFANTLVLAHATISCSDYSISFAANQLQVGTQYTIDYAFTINSTSAPSETITNSTSFTASASSQTVSVPATAVGPLTGTITVTSGSATLTSSGSTVAMVFRTNPSPLVCTPATGNIKGNFGFDILLLKNDPSGTGNYALNCNPTQPGTLDINWGVHRFQLQTVGSVTCLLVGNPTSSAAPVNEMIGSGTGELDGVTGYTVSFTLTDQGQPGNVTNFLIYQTANPSNVVLNVQLQSLIQGNLQAQQ
jgi:hypothetical protein